MNGDTYGYMDAVAWQWSMGWNERFRADLATHNQDLAASEARVKELEEGLFWIATFADTRQADDSKTFAKVARGALRTIRDRARALLSREG